MWPPQARTGLATLAVKVMAIWADLSPAKPAPSGYVYGPTLVIVAPHIENTPAIWWIGLPEPLSTWGSFGMAKVVGEPVQPLTPRHGSESATVRFQVVRKSIACLPDLVVSHWMMTVWDESG